MTRYNLVFPVSRKYNADFCVSRSSYKKTVTRPGDFMRLSRSQLPFVEVTVIFIGVTHQKKPVCCRRPECPNTPAQSFRSTTHNHADVLYCASFPPWEAGVFALFGAKVPQSTVSPMIQQQTLYLGGKVMLDHKKEAITEHWQFCPKCNLKLYRMTADCTGFIHIKCWRCREMLWLNLSIRAK